ncbi:MAG TPA: hypothetical protein VGN91_29500 [Bosea sp. (in: a-proteobacteria)]|jgi:hypothetical protein|nr:hypothetical protein [Bosea sp. (in: a-proteobacteria)]
MLKTLAIAALIGAAFSSTTSANAQYYDPYYRPAPRYDYDRPPPPYGYDRPRYRDDGPRYGYDRPQRRRFGDVCLTSRGSCAAEPAPRNSPCGCYIEGFGMKRGAIE